MKNTTKVLFIVILAWLLLIFALSSQNGPETAKTSEGMAYQISRIFLHTTDAAKVNHVHMILRKLAHVFLFFVLGILLAVLAEWITKGSSFKIRILTSYAFLIFCCFFDEWHKQFINGRHNDLRDVKLNVIGGSLGIGLMLVIWGIRAVRKNSPF